jgi:WD40 repeat protein
MIQQQQRIRLTQHAEGWSDRALGLVRAAAAIGVSDDLKGEAAAILVGLDAKVQKRILIPGCSLAFDPAGSRLLIGGTDREATLWHSATNRAESLPQNGPGSGPVAFRADGTPVQLVLDGMPAKCSVQLRDLARRRLLSQFEFPQEEALRSPTARPNPAMTLTPDASLAALAIARLDGTGTVFVWDGGTGALRHQFGDRATALAFSADGSLLATGDADGRITIRALATGATVATLQTGRVKIQCLAFGRDVRRGPAGAPTPAHAGTGWLLASGDAGGTVVVWDLGAKGPMTFCHGSHYEIYGVVFAPDGSTLASCGRVDVRLWDITSGRLLLGMSSGNRLGHPVFSSGGRFLAVLSSEDWREESPYEQVVVWTLENGRGIRTLGGLSSQVAKVIFAPDGKRIAALAHDWRVAVWDHDTGRLCHAFDVPRGRSADNAALAFSPDSRRFAFCAGQEAKLWDLESGEELRTWPLEPGMLDLLAFHPSGKLLLFRVETLGSEESQFDGGGRGPGDRPRVCRIRDLLGPDPRATLAEIGEFNADVFEAAAPVDGGYFVTEGIHRDSTGERRSIRAFDGPTGAEVWSLPVTKSVQWARLTPDPTGKVLAFLPEDAYRATLVAMPTGSPLGTMEGFADSLSAGADRMVVRVFARSGGYCESLRLIDRRAGRLLAILGVDTRTCSVVIPFSRDGIYLAWGSADGSVFVGDLAEVQRRLSSVRMGW